MTVLLLVRQATAAVCLGVRRFAPSHATPIHPLTPWSPVSPCSPAAMSNSNNPTGPINMLPVRLHAPPPDLPRGLGLGSRGAPAGQLQLQLGLGRTARSPGALR
jgi:hypothetical protein